MAAKTNKKRAGKKKHSNAILAIIFLVGLTILLYPPVSQRWNAHLQVRAVAVYEGAVADLSAKDREQMFEEACAYNTAFAGRGNTFELYGSEVDEYMRQLDPGGIGVMGTIEIPRIAQNLPIYHTVEDPVLENGIGHIPGTSLPVGGMSSHAVLSGHRGLPSSKLFTDLDKVGEGDVFFLHILGHTLAYEVDQIRIVQPNELTDLKIEEGKDYCTLVTCTPYSINTHRLLVRGHRIEYMDQGYVPADAVQIDQVLVASILSIPIFAVLFIYLMVATRRRRKRRLAQGLEEETNTRKHRKQTSKARTKK